MLSSWRLFLNTPSKQKAGKLIRRFQECIDNRDLQPMLEPYPKTGGFVAIFAIPLGSKTWNGAVVEVIALGQQAAEI